MPAQKHRQHRRADRKGGAVDDEDQLEFHPDEPEAAHPDPRGAKGRRSSQICGGRQGQFGLHEVYVDIRTLHVTRWRVGPASSCAEPGATRDRARHPFRCLSFPRRLAIWLEFRLYLQAASSCRLSLSVRLCRDQRRLPAARL